MFRGRRLPTVLGLTQRVSRRDRQDGVLVKRLRDAGAIVLGKTNVPQLMFYHETDNPVSGRTPNPWDVRRVAGGSSGGEASAIASGGSPLGLGSDIGGSIRVPCHFCGIAGLKPTSGRLPHEGSFALQRGMEAIIYQSGPMAHYVCDLRLAMKALTVATGAIDTLASPPVPWREEGEAPDDTASDITLPARGLRIGVCEDDPFFPVAPSVQRGVREAAAALERQGASIEPFALPEIDKAIAIYFRLMAADGSADLKRILGGSRPAPPMRRVLQASGIPNPIRQLLAVLMRWRGDTTWPSSSRQPAVLTPTNIGKRLMHATDIASTSGNAGINNNSMQSSVRSMPRLRSSMDKQSIFFRPQHRVTGQC